MTLASFFRYSDVLLENSTCIYKFVIFTGLCLYSVSSKAFLMLPFNGVTNSRGSSLVQHAWLAQYFQLFFISCYFLIQEENLLKRITRKTKYFKIDHLIADVYLRKPSLGYFGAMVNLGGS